jgi:feruloyl esterase
MYAGATNPRTHEQIYPGWPKGSEAGWQQYWGTTEPARVNFWRYWVFDNPNWDPWTFDFDRDLAHADAKVGKMIDQVNPDLTAFRRHGGRAIVYQGWQDPVVSALDTVGYYERLRGRTGSQADTDRFFRLFMVPGMSHCAGGSGTTSFGNQNAPSPLVDAEHDMLSALDAWVERGTPPDRIIASRVVNGSTVRTRPLCPYPRRAVYVGTGSADDAANFVCRAAQRPR